MYITNTANGKSAYGKVRDECPGCDSYDIGERTSTLLPLPGRSVLRVRLSTARCLHVRARRHEPVAL